MNPKKAAVLSGFVQNILAGSGLPAWVLLYDPMDGSSIHSMWEDNDTDNKIIPNPGAGHLDIDIDFDTNDNTIRGGSAITSLSTVDFPDDLLVMQITIKNQNYVGPSEASFVYIGLARSNETNLAVNSANIITRGTSGFDDQSIQAAIWQGASKDYTHHQAIDISEFQTFKIKINDTGDTIDFFYWIGPNGS
jgi:hypothetical protein